MSSAAGRSLAELVAAEAPLSARRAVAVALAVARAADDPDRVAGFSAADVVLHADGSVLVAGSGTATDAADAAGPSAGSSVGRILFELLVGRPPLGRDDAFEPAVRAALSPTSCALLARSCSSQPGQWPVAAEWVAALTAEAGGQAPPPTPAERAARRRRRAVVAVAVVILVTVVVAVLALVPRWWAGTDEGGRRAATVQAERASS